MQITENGNSKKCHACLSTVIGIFVALLNLRSRCTFSVSLSPSNLLGSSFILHLSDGKRAAQRSAEIGPSYKRNVQKEMNRGLKTSLLTQNSLCLIVCVCVRMPICICQYIFQHLRRRQQH